MPKNENSLSDRDLHKKLLALWRRGQSDLCEVRHSEIHGLGVYAARDIAAEEKIIEYVGVLIDKAESEKRGIKQQKRAVKTGDAAVYIFTLNRKYDIDGNLPWNTARLINHSCEPNCQAWLQRNRISIHALRPIRKGDELCFDYGFDVECYEDHPCRCGTRSCVGYIVSREQWSILDQKLGRASQNSSATF